MRKTRFEPKIKNKSYIFLPPMLEIDPVYMQMHLLLNVYLSSDDLPDVKNCMFLHYEYQDRDGSFGRLENTLTKHPDYRGMYEPDKYTTLFYFYIPEKWYTDYLVFLNSRYSLVSESLKNRILKFHSLGIQSTVYKVLYRDVEKRRELEESLDVTLPDSAEVASAIEFSKETYSEAHKIKKLSNQNSEIWEIN